MKTTVTINDDLYQQVKELAGPGLDEPSDLIREAMQTYVRVQAARQLADMGGEMPDMKDIPRRGEFRDLNELITNCLEKKEGSREFALFYMLDGAPVWQAMLGNEQPYALGESRGEFLGVGSSPNEAVEALRSNHIRGNLNQDYDWLLMWDRTSWLEGFNAEGREYKWDDEDRLYSDLMTFMYSKGNPASNG
jgi:predicted transcriptional regulator